MGSNPTPSAIFSWVYAMPHAILEYSSNLSADMASGHLTDLVHEVMIQSGLFQTDSIKTRSCVVSDFRVGAKGRDGSFVYLSIALLDGRTLEQRQTLSDNLLKAIGPALAHVDQFTVEIREMDKETYRKYGA